MNLRELQEQIARILADNDDAGDWLVLVNVSEDPEDEIWHELESCDAGEPAGEPVLLHVGQLVSC